MGRRFLVARFRRADFPTLPRSARCGVGRGQEENRRCTGSLQRRRSRLRQAQGVTYEGN